MIFPISNMHDFRSQRAKRRFKTRRSKVQLTAAQKRDLKAKKEKRRGQK